MTVYADSLFLVNFLSEYFLLVLTEKIASVNSKRIRRISAALFGAVVSTAVFCDKIPLPQSIIGTINAFFIVCIAYTKSSRSVIRAFLTFMLVSFVYYGFINLSVGSAAMHNGITYLKINLGMFAVIFLCAYLFIIFTARILKPSGRRIYKITVSKNKKTVSLTALFDSGNLLSDGKKGVIITEWDMIKPLFDTEIFEELYEYENVKVLPFGSLGGCSTVLVFRADSLRTEYKEFFDVPVGIVKRHITQNGTYNALIGKQYF